MNQLGTPSTGSSPITSNPKEGGEEPSHQSRVAAQAALGVVAVGGHVKRVVPHPPSEDSDRLVDLVRAQAADLGHAVSADLRRRRPPRRPRRRGRFCSPSVCSGGGLTSDACAAERPTLSIRTSVFSPTRRAAPETETT
jgi:hypothetical protein